MKDFGEFDYVVVGGGTAGCVVANRLSADPDVTVLLLEAGARDDWIWIHIPIGYLYCINNPRTDWCYKTEPEPGLNDRSIGYARGKVLGGSSSINAMLCLRGQVRDYEEWARITGDSRWNWENVLPVFKRSESYWRGADEMHDGVSVLGARPGRADHGPVQPAARGEDARGVDQHDLRLAGHRHAAHGEAGGLHLAGDDGDLGADQAVDQGRFAGVGGADDGGEAGAGGSILWGDGGH